MSANTPIRTTLAVGLLSTAFAWSGDAAPSRETSSSPIDTGRYTYEGHGSVNTHWIETPTSVIVIDVQRDTTHAAERLEAGPSEATGATVPYLPDSKDLYVGDLILSGMHGFFLEERSTELLATLEELVALFPLDATVHPGHGDPGQFDELVTIRIEYTERARHLASEAIDAGLTGTDAVVSVRDGLLAEYPDHGVPGGQPDMVELSAGGVLAELRDLRAERETRAAEATVR